MVTVKSKAQKPKNYYSNRLNVVPPPIQLKRATWSKNTDDGAVTTFKLRCTPSDTDSLQYELKVRSFESGSVEQYILWKRDLDKLFKGQNLSNAEDKFEMTRKVLTGDALAVFQEAAYAQIVEDDNSYAICIDALALHVFPKNALTHQKAWMRRSEYAHKPIKAKTRTWVARLNEINQMLAQFPPFFSEAQMLEEDELIEIIEYGIPTSWRVKMVDQSFIPGDHTLTQLIEFCEKEETTEQMMTDAKPDSGNGNQQSKSNNGNNANKTNDRSSGGNKRKTYDTVIVSYEESGGKDGCLIHTKATNHTSNQCHVLKNKVAKLNQSWQDSSDKQSPQKRQRTGNSNGNRGTNPSKNGGDLHVIMEQFKKVSESLEKALKQQNTETGKRKRREKRVNFSSSDDEDHQVEEVEPDDSFVCELDQLSLSDADLQTLEPEEISE
jgi:NACalpha-BTF3-like transcription factor